MKKIGITVLMASLVTAIFSLSCLAADYVPSPTRKEEPEWVGVGEWVYDDNKQGSWESAPNDETKNPDDGIWKSNHGIIGTWDSVDGGISGTWESETGKRGHWRFGSLQEGEDFPGIGEIGTFRTADGKTGIWRAERSLNGIDSPQTGEKFPVAWVALSVVFGVLAVLFLFFGIRQSRKDRER